MVQIVPTGYDYIGRCRNCLKEGRGGGEVQPIMISYVHHLVRKGGIIALKNNPFLVGGGGGCNHSICGMAGQFVRAENKDKSWF